jgi:hypothetical protein
VELRWWCVSVYAILSMEMLNSEVDIAMPSVRISYILCRVPYLTSMSYMVFSVTVLSSLI